MGRNRKADENLTNHQNLIYIEAKRENMREACRLYNSQPIYKMTAEDAGKFAIRQSRDAQRTLRLSDRESIRYAAVIYDAIQ